MTTIQEKLERLVRDDQAVAYFVEIIEARVAAGVVDLGAYLDETREHLARDESELIDAILELQEDQYADRRRRLDAKREAVEIIHRRELGPRVHRFETDVDAYDESQTSEEILDGDVLVVGQRAAILVEAWPTIVAGEPGEFHELAEGRDWSDLDEGKYLRSYQVAIAASRESSLDVVAEELGSPAMAEAVAKVEAMTSAPAVVDLQIRAADQLRARTTELVAGVKVDGLAPPTATAVVRHLIARNENGYAGSPEPFELRELLAYVYARLVDVELEREPFFDSMSQETRVADERVFDLQSQREGTYLGRRRGWGDVAVVLFDGDAEPTEMSHADVKALYR